MPNLRFILGAMLVALATPAQAVYVNPEGLGQALIFPYYTVRSGEGGVFNTYLSIVNSSEDDKALRVRFREARNGRAVASFNVYLGRGDVWAAALVPSTAGTRLVTIDQSCTDPALPASGLDFSAAGYSGDGGGDGLDRTREGYVEVLEMATLVGPSAFAMTHTSSALPAYCDRLGAVSTADLRSPTGGISGTLTLINVADGSDYSLNAEALAGLSRSPFFRQGADAYPGLDAIEIERVSVVASKGVVYRSRWPRGIDAVSAALMRDSATGDYALDAVTQSRSEVFVAFPTRPMHVTATEASAPFDRAGNWSPQCAGPRGEQIGVDYFNRATSGAALTDGSGFGGLSGPPIAICSAAAAIPVGKGSASAGLTGSTIDGFPPSTVSVRSTFDNGWIRIVGGGRGMTSLPDSTRLDSASGTVTVGAHLIYGLPMVGFAIRSLRNGTLSCPGAAACQGNYGSAFPMRYTRNIAPAP